MENNTHQPDLIEVPSIDTIQELPKVELPKLDDVQPSAVAEAAQTQAVPTTQEVPAAQAVPTAQAIPQTYNYVPTAQPILVRKRSGGQIAAMVFGIILTVIFGLLELLVFVADLGTQFVNSSEFIPVYIFFGVFLALGIFLLVIGLRKGKKIVSQTNPVQYGSMPAQPAYPVQTAAPVQPASVPVQTAAPAQPASSPVQTAAPVQPASVPVQTAVPAQPAQTASPAAFDYAPSAYISDDSKSVAKKIARKSAFLSIGIVIAMWAILFLAAWFIEKWYFPWYLLIIPVIVSIGAIKNYPKSISAWVSLIFSILSIVAFVFISIQLLPYLE